MIIPTANPPIPRIDYTDFITGVPKSFASSDRGGQTLSMYTKYASNRSAGVVPIYLGTITNNRVPFRSVSQGATVISTAPGSQGGAGILLELILGAARISVLDGIPEGLTWRVVPSEGVIFSGNNVQTIPANVRSAINNPGPDNYPVNTSLNNSRCYFRIRATRSNFPQYTSTWLYYFIVRTNWTDIRDAFISNIGDSVFSFDQKNTVTAREFIAQQKANGNY